MRIEPNAIATHKVRPCVERVDDSAWIEIHTQQLDCTRQCLVANYIDESAGERWVLPIKYVGTLLCWVDEDGTE